MIEKKMNTEEFDKKLVHGKKQLLDRKKSNYLKIFTIFILILIGLVTYFNLDDAPTSLKRIFKDSNLGNIKKVKVTSWNDNGKTLNFKARDINYKALIKENGEIYQIFVGTGENFPIFEKTKKSADTFKYQH